MLEAEKLDPRIPQIHVARSVILYSRFENWNLRDAILEMRTARKLDPNSGHSELAYLYWHTGLEALGEKHQQAFFAAEPQSIAARTVLIEGYYMSLLVDEGAALERRLFNREPQAAYYLAKGRAKEAEPFIQKQYGLDPFNLRSRLERALVFALQNNRPAALELLSAAEKEAEKRTRLQPFHHISYRIAEIHASLGNAQKAADWLQITVDSGWPQYPMMRRDILLDPVRNHPAVAKVLASVKSTWEKHMLEFGSEEQ